MSPDLRSAGVVPTGPPEKASGHRGRKLTELQLQVLGIKAIVRPRFSDRKTFTTALCVRKPLRWYIVHCLFSCVLITIGYIALGL